VARQLSIVLSFATLLHVRNRIPFFNYIFGQTRKNLQINVIIYVKCTTKKFSTIEDCSDSFPSKQGLTNHVRNHRRRDSLQAAEVPLPAPATRQRTRAHPTVRPVCGGDARVPAGEMVEVTEDMPRILDGNRPPDTGLVFVYRFLLPSQRQPSQGYRLVIELVNLPGWASWGSSSTPRSAHLCIYPVGVRDTRFMLQGSPLRPLAEGKAATFLGAQVGFNVVPPLSTLAEIIYIGLRIARSMLAPWQRIDALKTFYYPSTVHLQRLGVLPKTDWARVDSILRTEIKKTLYLPQEASGEYLYGSTRRGCCGIRILAEDSDMPSS